MSSMSLILWISRISNISQCQETGGLISLTFSILTQPIPPELLPILALTAAPLTILENSLRRRDTIHTNSGKTMLLYSRQVLTESHGMQPNTTTGRRCTMVLSGSTLLAARCSLVLISAKQIMLVLVAYIKTRPLLAGGKTLTMPLQQILMTPRIS